MDVCLPCGAGGGRGGDLARTAGRPLPAVLICPGGGYRVVGSTEAGPVSDKFADAGYAAFILHYTVGDGASFGAEGFAGFAPAADLAAALRLLHENAGGYGIDAREIVLVGFSAGGHLCAAYCFADAPIPERLLPKALVLSYPMGGGEDSGGMGKAQPDYDVGRMPYAKDPAVKNLPVFLWHAKDDAVVPFEVSARLDAKLAREGITHTFLAYEHGIHARPFFDPDWFSRALDWLAGLK
ncbi:MAG: alpha/beta hydrolase [Clostridiales Family XIII bacterium]|nr:alpha/beta hydrolase [Clostridiales Family XIII bacterium]